MCMLLIPWLLMMSITLEILLLKILIVDALTKFASNYDLNEKKWKIVNKKI